MIAKIYIKGVIALITCFSNIQPDNTERFDYIPKPKAQMYTTLFSEVENNFDTILNKANFTTIRNQLLSDYQEILKFSEKMRFYGITRGNFETLFQNGFRKSFNFHQSPQYIKQSYVNRMIEKKLFHHPDLKHPLKKPSKSNSDSLKGFDVLNTFSGEWFGKWQSMNVRHLWLPFREGNLKESNLYEVIGFQTCFIGDGFGWNYLVRTKDETIILGYVYHFDKKGKLISENPHYAFLNDQSQLTWVSDNHIYYEFVCDSNNCARGRHYVITGMPYYPKTKKSKFGSAFQAIYCSENSETSIFTTL